MPSLAELTDQSPQQDNSLPVEQPYRGGNLGPLQGSNSGIVGNTTAIVPAAPDTVAQPDPNSVGSSGSQIIDKLLGLGGQERYQLWPEKVVRDAISAPHDIIQANPYPEGSEENSWFEDQRAKSLVPAALNMSALAGTGGLAGTGAEVGEALGSGPFLRPALKVGDKIYKAPIKDAENPLGFGAEHSDALPAHLADDFYKKAMSGEDINHYNFGFVNHKGQFLDRGKALDYGIEQGLVDPQNGKYGVLTSTMLADSSKPGTAIEAMAKTNQPFYSALEHNVNAIQQPKMTGDQWLGTLANKPGVKPEELDWTGTKEFLQSKGKEPVTKAELQEHLQNNKVELKEVDKGAPFEAPEIAAKREEFQTLNDKAEEVERKGGNLTHQEYERMNELSSELAQHPNPWLSKSVDTKYHSYQLAGGENYREKLLMLPGKQLNEAQARQVLGAKPDAKLSASDIDYASKKAASDYKSSHWDEPNILAHVRMNDRMIPIEHTAEENAALAVHEKAQNELASIRSQQGEVAKQINVTAKPLNEARIKNIVADLKAGKISNAESMRLFEAYPEHPELKPLQDKLQALRAKEDALNKSLPTKPIQQTKKSLGILEAQSDWHQQGRKKGYTPTEAERLAASDKIKEIRKEQQKLLDKNGTPTGDNRPKWIELDEKAAELGRVASKMGGTVPDAPFKKTWHELVLKRMIREAAEKGYDNLHFPGSPETVAKVEGWSNFKTKTVDGEKRYFTGDQDVTPIVNRYIVDFPRFLNKIGKEHGVKVNSLEIPGKLSNKMGEPPETIKLNHMNIPESLKDTALGKGFPLFSSTHIFTPVSHNPFEEKKKK